MRSRLLPRASQIRAAGQVIRRLNEIVRQETAKTGNVAGISGIFKNEGAVVSKTNAEFQRVERFVAQRMGYADGMVGTIGKSFGAAVGIEAEAAKNIYASAAA